MSPFFPPPGSVAGDGVLEVGASRGWVLCSGLAESGSSLATINNTSPLLTPLLKGRLFLAGVPLGPDSWGFSPLMVISTGSMVPASSPFLPRMSALRGEPDLAFWLPGLVPVLGWPVETSGISRSGEARAASFLSLASLDSFSVSRTSCLMKPPGMTEKRGGGEDGGGLLSSSRIFCSHRARRDEMAMLRQCQDREVR